MNMVPPYYGSKRAIACSRRHTARDRFSPYEPNGGAETGATNAACSQRFICAPGGYSD